MILALFSRGDPELSNQREEGSLKGKGFYQAFARVLIPAFDWSGIKLKLKTLIIKIGMSTRTYNNISTNGVIMILICALEVIHRDVLATYENGYVSKLRLHRHASCIKSQLSNQKALSVARGYPVIKIEIRQKYWAFNDYTSCIT